MEEKRFRQCEQRKDPEFLLEKLKAGGSYRKRLWWEMRLERWAGNRS